MHSAKKTTDGAMMVAIVGLLLLLNRQLPVLLNMRCIGFCLFQFLSIQSSMAGKAQ